jgi:hypothetical protein
VLSSKNLCFYEYFCGVTLCTLVQIYQRFGGIFIPVFIIVLEDGGGKFPRNPACISEDGKPAGNRRDILKTDSVNTSSSLDVRDQVLNPHKTTDKPVIFVRKTARNKNPVLISTGFSELQAKLL